MGTQVKKEVLEHLKSAQTLGNFFKNQLSAYLGKNFLWIAHGTNIIGGN